MAGFRTQGLDHVALAVDDVQRSRRFYEDVIGLERVLAGSEPPVMMLAEGTGLALFPSLGDVAAWVGARQPGDIPHIAFRLDREAFATARGELAEMGMGSQVANHGISHSMYLRDPDGYLIELTTYDL